MNEFWKYASENGIGAMALDNMDISTACKWVEKLHPVFGHRLVYKINDLTRDSAEYKNFMWLCHQHGALVFKDMKIYDVPDTIKNSVNKALQEKGTTILTLAPHQEDESYIAAFAQAQAMQSQVRILSVTDLTSSSAPVEIAVERAITLARLMKMFPDVATGLVMPARALAIIRWARDWREDREVPDMVYKVLSKRENTKSIKNVCSLSNELYDFLINTFCLIPAIRRQNQKTDSQNPEKVSTVEMLQEFAGRGAKPTPVLGGVVFRPEDPSEDPIDSTVACFKGLGWKITPNSPENFIF